MCLNAVETHFDRGGRPLIEGINAVVMIARAIRAVRMCVNNSKQPSETHIDGELVGRLLIEGINLVDNNGVHYTGS